MQFLDMEIWMEITGKFQMIRDQHSCFMAMAISAEDINLKKFLTGKFVRTLIKNLTLSNYLNNLSVL